MHEHARAAVPPPAPEPLPERHLAQRDGAAPGQQARGLRPAPRGRRPPPAGLPAAARDGISGTGTPLEGGLRARMEAAFSQDLSAVRVHSDPAAHRAALALHARAFAVGDHIVLGPGNGQGDTELVGHELAHVVQHRPVPGGAAGPATGGPSGSGPFEQEATAAGARASAGQAVAVAAPGGAPAVQLDRLTFGAGSTQVVVENGVVTVNGTKIPATAGSDGRLWFRNREIVLDRSGVLRYRDRYTVCFSCNPDYYEGPRWTAKAGTALPELEGTFYDTAARRWTLRREPVVTTAVVQPPGGAAAGAPPGPVNPALQSRVERAAAAREQFEARVNQAMAEGRRTRPDAERIVRQRLREGLGRSGLGEFESGQTYAVVEEELEPGLTRRTTTGAVHGGEVPTVQVPSTELKTRLGELNRRLGETFRFNEQTLNHAEVRAIVRTPTATTFYVNRDMCSSCERFFLLEARAQGREITVVAPSSTKVFTPDLQIVEYRPGVVYERRAAISRAEGVSTLELGDQPAVTHSVRPVQRTTPVSESELPPSERPLARPAASGDTARAGGTAAAEAEGAGGSAARATPAEPGTGTAPRAAVPEPATKKPTPPEAPGPRGAARPGSVELPGVARPGAAGPRGSAVAEAAESGLGRTAARAGAGGIRRFALGAAGSLAEAALGVALLLVDVIIALVVVPYLEKLQRKLEEEHRARLQEQIRRYYEQNMAAQAQNRVLALAERIRAIEDRDGQPYVNTTVTVRFERSWNLLTGQGSGPPESILDLSFNSLEDLQVRVDETPVAESADALVAEDTLPLLGDRFSTRFRQTIHFPAIPPTYQQLVNQFGVDPASRASGCFIATACYGSPDAGPVLVLRRFRDRVLLPRASGRRFVRWYYRTSPPVAEALRRRPRARSAVRVLVVAPLAAAVGLLPGCRPKAINDSSCALGPIPSSRWSVRQKAV